VVFVGFLIAIHEIIPLAIASNSTPV